MIRPHLLNVLLLAGLGLSGCSQNSAQTEPDSPVVSSTAFNAELAAELGADDYGMRSYVMVVLKTGPKDAEITDADERTEIFKGHFSNMKTLAEAKKLVLSGPFTEGEGKRGLYIFNVATIPEAEELVQSDPAVAAGIFVPEFTKYYGSAALMQIQDVHQTIQKTKI
ncbi:MAG: YciI family protein [Litorimonas sp.]